MFEWIHAIFATHREVMKMATQVNALSGELAAVAARLEEAQAETAADIQALNDEIAMLVEQLGQATTEIPVDAEEALQRVKDLAQALADRNPATTAVEPPAEPVV